MQIDGVIPSTEHIIKNPNETIVDALNPVKKDAEMKQIKQDKTVSEDNIVEKQHLVDALEKMSRAIEIFNKRLKFSIDEDSRRIVVKVIDSETNKVIREIPPKEVLKFVVNLHKFLGIFVDKKR